MIQIKPPGAIGNCWFAGALSVVAQRPKIIENMFPLSAKMVEKYEAATNPETGRCSLVSRGGFYNPWGAYQVRLCHAGVWRRILIDDVFPCSKTWDGRMEGGTIHFARGGELSYLQSRRRQLWVPLIEKAAAKLFTCYGALNSGTFGEALSLFTGNAVEMVRLYQTKGHKKAVEEARRRKEQEKTMRMVAALSGQAPQNQPKGAEIDEFHHDQTGRGRKLMNSIMIGQVGGGN
jgi:hypothetical protein